MSSLMTNFLSNDFFDDTFFGFGVKPFYNRFNTPLTKDITPVAPWKRDGDNYYTVVRMIGIDPEQVNISLEKYGLHIYGESEVFGEKYNQEIKIGMASEIIANIESVNYEVKNGMCKIILNMKKVEKQPIKISRI